MTSTISRKKLLKIIENQHLFSSILALKACLDKVVSRASAIRKQRENIDVKHGRHLRLSILFLAIPLLLGGETELILNPANLNLGVLSGQTGRTFVEIDNPGTEAHSYSLFRVPEESRSVQTAYYPFDGHFDDMFTCRNGTISNLSFVDDRNFWADSAVNCSGNSHYACRDFEVENNFAVSFWAKPEVAQTMYAEGYSNAPAYTNYLIGPEWGGVSNWAGFGIALGTNGIMLIEHGHAYMPRLLCYSANLSGWHHFTINFESHSPKLYIDGAFIRSGIPSQRSYTRLSHDIGGYVYGSYTGKLDELCVFISALDQSQISALFSFDGQQRYRISDQLGILNAGAGVNSQIKMIDTSLALGVYTDTFILCQGDSIPELQLLPVNLTITDQGPLAPQSVSISRLQSGDYLIQWVPVTQDTYGMAFTPSRYRIYRSDSPGSLEDFVEIGQSTDLQYVDARDPMEPENQIRFYLVRAE